jgi:hypothetical protein
MPRPEAVSWIWAKCGLSSGFRCFLGAHDVPLALAECCMGEMISYSLITELLVGRSSLFWKSKLLGEARHLSWAVLEVLSSLRLATDSQADYKNGEDQDAEGSGLLL